MVGEHHRPLMPIRCCCARLLVVAELERANLTVIPKYTERQRAQKQQSSLLQAVTHVLSTMKEWRDFFQVILALPMDLSTNVVYPIHR